MSKTDLSIVIPVYNNEETIIELFEAIQTNLKGYAINYEVIFVNDCSNDNSLLILREIDSKIKLVNNSINIGQHNSILIGMEKATGRKIMVMDADLQDSPNIIPALFFKSEGLDNLFIYRKGKYQSWSRMITSRIFKYLIFFLAKLPPQAGTFFIIDNSVRNKILKLKCKTPYVTVLIACTVTRINGILYKRQKRVNGKSSYNFVKRVKSGLNGVLCAWECKYLN